MLSRITSKEMPPRPWQQGLGIILAVLMVLACSTTNLILESRLPLDRNQPHEGTHKSMDYQLTYRYVFRPGSLNEADRIEFVGKLTPRRGLNTLRLRLHLLDDADNLLATHVLYAPGTGQGAGRATINRTIEVPSGTEAIAFSHFSQENIRFSQSPQENIVPPHSG